MGKVGRNADLPSQFVFSQSPYCSRKNNHGGIIFMDIRAGLPPAERPVDLSSDLESVWKKLEECWDVDPATRPSAASLLAWFKGHAPGLLRQPLASERASNDADLIGPTKEGLGTFDVNMQQELAVGTTLDEANSPGMVSILFRF
jgi:hypothetical protein